MDAKTQPQNHSECLGRGRELIAILHSCSLLTGPFSVSLPKLYHAYGHKQYRMHSYTVLMTMLKKLYLCIFGSMHDFSFNSSLRAHASPSLGSYFLIYQDNMWKLQALVLMTVLETYFTLQL